MTEPDNPPAQTTTQECVTCGKPVRIAVEKAGNGPVKHDECPPPNHYERRNEKAPETR